MGYSPGNQQNHMISSPYSRIAPIRQCNYKGISVLASQNKNDADKVWSTKRCFDLTVTLQDHTSPYAYDIETIGHSSSFRRLRYVEQFTFGQNNHLTRNRAEHVSDVRETARILGQALGLDDESLEIVDAITMMHDMGHPPFAHDGEEALQEILAEYGLPYDHDMAAVRTATEWDRQWKDWSGTNLTLAVLEGLLKRYYLFTDDAPPEAWSRALPRVHSGDPIMQAGDLAPEHFVRFTASLPDSVRKIHQEKGLKLGKGQWNSIEGQVAAIADWISFTASDVTDFILMKESAHSKKGWSLKDFAEMIPQVKEAVITLGGDPEHTYLTPPPKNGDSHFDPVRNTIDNVRLYTEIRDNLINDIAREVERKLDKDLSLGEEHKKIRTASDIRDLDSIFVEFSEPTRKAVLQFQQFCSEKIFDNLGKRHAGERGAKKTLKTAFHALFNGQRPMVDSGGFNTYHDEKATRLRATIRDNEGEGGSPEEALKAKKALAETIVEFITLHTHDHNIASFIPHYYAMLNARRGDSGTGPSR